MLTIRAQGKYLNVGEKQHCGSERTIIRVKPGGEAFWEPTFPYRGPNRGGDAAADVRLCILTLPRFLNFPRKSAVGTSPARIACLQIACRASSVNRDAEQVSGWRVSHSARDRKGEFLPLQLLSSVKLQLSSVKAKRGISSRNLLHLVVLASR